MQSKIDTLTELLADICLPKRVMPCVEEIDLLPYFKQGYTTVLLDIDDTIVPIESSTVALQKTQWINQAKLLGLSVYAISNNSSHYRIKKICKQLEIEGLYFAMKPFVYCTKELFEKKNIEASKCLMVGDKLFTDIIFANWLGATSILVNPLTKKKSLLTNFRTQFEKKVIETLKKIHKIKK